MSKHSKAYIDSMRSRGYVQRKCPGSQQPGRVVLEPRGHSPLGTVVCEHCNRAQNYSPKYPETLVMPAHRRFVNPAMLASQG